VTRIRLSDVACSIARTTDLFGDAWTALIMRDVLLGVGRFDDLAEDLGISRKVLAARLTRLVEEGILVRERYRERPARYQYVPTDKGKELFPVLVALMTWGDRWNAGDAGPPVRIHHLDCGADTVAVTVCGHCREPLTVDNTAQLPGPGGRIGPGTSVLGPRLMTQRLPPAATPGRTPSPDRP
jgi:DNA-binding HxlR family transcriptional regulator